MSNWRGITMYVLLYNFKNDYLIFVNYVNLEIIKVKISNNQLLNTIELPTDFGQVFELTFKNQEICHIQKQSAFFEEMMRLQITALSRILKSFLNLKIEVDMTSIADLFIVQEGVRKSLMENSFNPKQRVIFSKMHQILLNILNAILMVDLTPDQGQPILIKSEIQKLKEFEFYFYQLREFWCINTNQTLSIQEGKRKNNSFDTNERKASDKNTSIQEGFNIPELKKIENEDLLKLITPEKDLEIISESSIELSESEIERIAVRAHFRKGYAMSNKKKEQIIQFLHHNDLLIENEKFTLDSFDPNDPRWLTMTIVDAFEKEPFLSVNTNDDVDDFYGNYLSKEEKTAASCQIHQELIYKMAATLKQLYEIIPSYNQFIDLLFELEDTTFICEMKSINVNDKNEYTQILKAFAQLCFYSHLHGLEEGTVKVVVCSEKLSDYRLINLLHSYHINIVWLENDKFITYACSHPLLIKVLQKQVKIKKR